MTVPITDRTNVFLGKHLLQDDTVEKVKEIAKEEASKVFEKTLPELKIALKAEADICCKATAPIITIPSKEVVEHTSPTAAVPIVNEAIDTYVANVSKKVSEHVIDTCIDSSVKKVTDTVIDASIDSSRSIVARIYNYVRGIFG